MGYLCHCQVGVTTNLIEVTKVKEKLENIHEKTEELKNFSFGNNHNKEQIRTQRIRLRKRKGR